MFFWNVAFSYDYSTISVGVEAENEGEAVEFAAEIISDEWGEGTADYSDVTAEPLYYVETEED